MIAEKLLYVRTRIFFLHKLEASIMRHLEILVKRGMLENRAQKTSSQLQDLSRYSHHRI